MPTTATHIGQIGRVMVPVSDQDRAIEFYVEKLGFELRADIPYAGTERWVEVAPPGSQAALALVPSTDRYPAGGNTGVALTTDDVDASHSALRGRGIDVDEEIMRGDETVPQMFWFRDEDGNILLLVESD